MSSLCGRLLRILPFAIAVSYMAVFSMLDNYPYALSSIDDQGLFQRIALNLLKRGAFSGSLTGHAPFCPTRPPLYPFILALTWKITGSMSLFPIRLIQGICYLLTLYLISRIAVIVSNGDRRYGLFSALFASLIPFAAAATHVILTESLSLFFLTLSVFLAAQFRERACRTFLVALGTCLGLLTLLRPTFMLIPVLLLGYIVLAPKIRRKDILPVVILVTLPLTAVVGTWSLYARSETGTWSLVRAGVGFNLMTGIIRNDTSLRETLIRHWGDVEQDAGNKHSLQKKLNNLLNAEKEPSSWEDASRPTTWRLIDLTSAAYLQEWHTDPPSAGLVIRSDNFLKKMALLWIRGHPRLFPGIVLSHIETLLFGDYQPLAYHTIGGYPYLYTTIVRLGLYLLFFLGTVLLLLQGRFKIIFFPLAIMFYLIIVHSPMHTEPRYFMYAYTFMPMTLPALLPLRFFRNGQSSSGY